MKGIWKLLRKHLLDEVATMKIDLKKCSMIVANALSLAKVSTLKTFGKGI